MILNETIRFESAPADVRKTFRGQQATKILLHPGRCLYKFTSHPLFAVNGGVTPFWSSVEPINAADTGLAGLEQRAGILGSTPSATARARSAVTRQWNSMNGLLGARLIAPVFAFAGQCSGQRFDKDVSFLNVSFIGGAWQLWIPGLSVRTILHDPSI